MCCKEVSSSVVSNQVSGPRRLSLMQSKSVQVEGRPACVDSGAPEWKFWGIYVIFNIQLDL